jgi:hypothetical protein
MFSSEKKWSNPSYCFIWKPKLCLFRWLDQRPRSSGSVGVCDTSELVKPCIMFVFMFLAVAATWTTREAVSQPLFDLWGSSHQLTCSSLVARFVVPACTEDESWMHSWLAQQLTSGSNRRCPIPWQGIRSGQACSCYWSSWYYQTRPASATAAPVRPCVVPEHHMVVACGVNHNWSCRYLSQLVPAHAKELQGMGWEQSWFDRTWDLTDWPSDLTSLSPPPFDSSADHGGEELEHGLDAFRIRCHQGKWFPFSNVWRTLLTDGEFDSLRRPRCRRTNPSQTRGRKEIIFW